MEDSLNSITTEQAQNGSSLLVVDLDSMPNHTLESEADNSIPPLQGNYLKINYPRLRTKLKASFLKLGFLNPLRTITNWPYKI